MIPGKRGFSLVELVIFIVVAGIFAPLTYIAFSSAMRQATLPEDYTTARAVAEQALELACSKSFSTLQGWISGAVPTCASLGVSVPTGFGCAVAPAYYSYTGPPTSSTNNYIRVRVTITMPSGSTFVSNSMATNHW